jgi:hypothetical protein
MFVDNGVQTAINNLPFTMNNSLLENRAKFVPFANISGAGLAYMIIQVVDAFGVSAQVSIIYLLPIYTT